jgi:RecA/RadA recombinase
MAARVKKTEEKKLTPEEKLERFLNTHKDDHYNFAKERKLLVSSGSLILDYYLGGGFCSGLHRFVGNFGAGKSSCALTVCKNFLDDAPKKRKAIIIPTEGRLPQELKDRSGISYVTSPKEWKPGTAFVYESQIYESVASLVRDLILDDSGFQYFFLLDSVDGLIPRGDLTKPFEDSAKVAGGATIASHWMKRIAIPLAKFGHMAVFTSQVRASISLTPYSPNPPKQTTATGGNALLHYANWILQFEPQYQNDVILTRQDKPIDAQKNPPLGHLAKVIVKKSPNEKNKLLIKYPIKYGRSGGKSVWIEKEVIDLLLMWGLAHKTGAWFSFDKELIDEAKEEEVEVEGKKFQGYEALANYVGDNPKVLLFLEKYAKNLIYMNQ